MHMGQCCLQMMQFVFKLATMVGKSSAFNVGPLMAVPGRVGFSRGSLWRMDRLSHTITLPINCVVLLYVLNMLD